MSRFIVMVKVLIYEVNVGTIRVLEDGVMLGLHSNDTPVMIHIRTSQEEATIGFARHEYTI